MSVIGLLEKEQALSRLVHAYRVSLLARFAEEVQVAASWADVSAALSAQKAMVAVVDPYWGGAFDLSSIQKLSREYPGCVYCYADFSKRPAGEHVRLLLSVGVERVVTLGVDDTCDELAFVLDRAAGMQLLGPLLRRLKELLPLPQYLAFRWSIREGRHETSVESMARALGVRPRTVRRWFEKSLTMSPRDVVDWGRLLQAGAVMQVTHLPPKELASVLRFSDYRGLVRMHRRLVGENVEGTLNGESLFPSVAAALLRAVQGQ